MKTILRTIVSCPLLAVWSVLRCLWRTLSRVQFMRGVISIPAVVGIDKYNIDSIDRDLLRWVSKLLITDQSPFPVPVDLGPSWRDGIALCHLINSISPGACPDAASLKTYNRVRNCRLALRLASKHLHLPTNAFSAEDIASYAENQEQKVRSLLLTIKRLAAAAIQFPLNVQDQNTDSQSEELIETQPTTTPTNAAEVECAQQEAISCLVGKPCNIELCLPSWMDPDELSAEVQWCDMDPSPVSPASVNPYINVEIHRSIDEAPNATSAVVLSFVPCRCGKHEAFVRWRGDDVTGSPFSINVGNARDSVRCSIDVERPTFRSAASRVMSRVKRTNKLRFANDVCTSDGQKHPLLGERPTLYGVAAAVLRRTSKVERTLDNGISRPDDHLVNIKIKRRRIIRQTVCSIDGTEKLGVIIGEDPTPPVGRYKWASIDCLDNVTSLESTTQRSAGRSSGTQAPVTDALGQRGEPEVERASNAAEYKEFDTTRREDAAEHDRCAASLASTITSKMTGLPLGFDLNESTMSSTSPNEENQIINLQIPGHNSSPSSDFQTDNCTSKNFVKSSYLQPTTEPLMSEGDITARGRFLRQSCDGDLVAAAAACLDETGDTNAEARGANLKTAISLLDESFSVSSSRRTSFSRQNAFDRRSTLRSNSSISGTPVERLQPDHYSSASNAEHLAQPHEKDESESLLTIPTQSMGPADDQGDRCDKPYPQPLDANEICSSKDDMKTTAREDRVTCWRNAATQTSLVTGKSSLVDHSTQTQVFTQERRPSKPQFPAPKYVTPGVAGDALVVDEESEQSVRPSTPYVHMVPSAECYYNDQLRRQRRRRQEVNSTACSNVMQPSITVSTTCVARKQNSPANKQLDEKDSDSRENCSFQVSYKFVSNW